LKSRSKAILLALAAMCLAEGASAQSCSPPLKTALEVDLYFGRAVVSDAQWAAFLAEEVTPRFPDGLSVLDVAGQYRAPGGPIVRENSKLMAIIVFDAPAHDTKVQAIVDAYKMRFRQQSVLRVEHAVCAAG
jgi:hypothetical protein